MLVSMLFTYFLIMALKLHFFGTYLFIQTKPSQITSPLVWKQIGQTIFGLSTYDQSGFSVSISAHNQVLAIGAPGNMRAGDRPGYARVYRREDSRSTWELVQKLNGNEHGDNFGRSG